MDPYHPFIHTMELERVEECCLKQEHGRVRNTFPMSRSCVGVGSCELYPLQRTTWNPITTGPPRTPRTGEAVVRCEGSAVGRPREPRSHSPGGLARGWGKPGSPCAMTHSHSSHDVQLGFVCPHLRRSRFVRGSSLHVRRLRTLVKQ